MGDNILVSPKVKEENKELIRKYPWLLPRNRFTDEVPEDYDYSYTELDDMPDGWRKAFGEKLCEEIQAELEKFDYVKDFRILQTKEKYGSLRIYTNGTPVGKLAEADEVVTVKDWKDAPRGDYAKDLWIYKGENEKGEYVFEHQKILDKCRINDIIDKYEDISERICISCGKPATLISQGWISPWCHDCAWKIENQRHNRLREMGIDEDVSLDDYMPIEKYFFKLSFLFLKDTKIKMEMA